MTRIATLLSSKHTSKLLCAFLLIVTLGFIPLTAYADQAPTKLYVNGTDIMTVADKTVQCGSGTATYDSATNTLTLENATMDGDFPNSATAFSNGAITAYDGDLNLNLVGENKINYTGLQRAVYSKTGDVNITGSGSLTIDLRNSTADSRPFSISPGKTGSVSIKGVTLTLLGCDGIETWDGDISIENATVISDGEEGFLSSTGDITISNSTVRATTSDYHNVIYAHGGSSGVATNIYISNSTVEVTSTYQGNGSPTFYAGDIYITDNSKVTISSLDSGALHAERSLSVENSTLDATTDANHVIWIDNDGAITVKNATLEAHAAANNVQALSTDTITISGVSDVLADGGIWALQLTATPDPGKMYEYKAGAFADKEAGAKHIDNSPYSQAFTYNNGDTALNYGYIHIKGHVHSGGTAVCVESDMICDDCGQVYRGGIDPHNHVNLVKVEAKDPTCTEAGNIEYWYCDACDKYYRDAAATNEIARADTVLPAKGHVLNEWHYDEHDHWHICEVCGVQLDLGEHVFSMEIKAPTATEPGWKHEECTVCGYERNAEILATGSDDTGSDDASSDEGQDAADETPFTGESILAIIVIALMLLAAAGLIIYSRRVSNK